MIHQLFEQHFFLLLTLTGCFGLLMGSFLNVVIYRIPVMLNRLWTHECQSFLDEQQGKESDPFLGPKFNLTWPNSHCPSCEHPLGLLENIPLLSFLWLKGQCRHCHAPISRRYPGVELLTAVLTAVTVSQMGLGGMTWFALVLTWVLIALSFIDLEHKLLPDNLTLPFLWVGLLCNSFFAFTTPTDAIIGAIVGYLSFWSVYQVFKLVTGKEGMGHGDFKLMALIGGWLGWQIIPLVIILSSILGAFIGIMLMAFAGRDKSNPIPFGPYIALAGWIAMLWGDIIISKYFHYLGIQIVL